MTRLAQLALPGLLVVGAVVAMVYAVAAIAFEWEIYVGEAQNAYFADRLAGDGTLYFDWNDDDLYFPIYAPGYYVLVAPFTWVLDEITAGRLVSFACCAFAAGAAGLTARRLGSNRPEAIASALAFVSVPAGAVVLFNARPDGLALALMAAAILFATIWEDERAEGFLVAAALVSVALLFTRQNYAPIALAIFLGLLLADRRAGLRFAAIALGAGLAVLLATNLLTDGAFLDNQRDFNEIGYSLPSLRGVIDLVTLPYPNPIFAVGAVEVAIAIVAWRDARAAVWAWLGGLAVLFTAVRIGASDNYVLALGLASSILLGPALARARRNSGERVAAAVAAGVALLLLPATVQAVRQLPNDLDHLTEVDAAHASALGKMEVVEGPVFGDRLDLALASGNAPGLDGFNHTKLAEVGVWDPAGLAARIRAEDFALVQTSFDAEHAEGWPPELVAAIRDSYCESFTAPLDYPPQGIYLYEPCTPR